MQKITNISELNNAIQLLELEQEFNKQLIKEECQATLIKLKPVNLIGRAIKNMVSSSLATNNLLGNVVGLATGYITKKLVVGGSNNRFRKILGSAIQFGVTGLINKNPEAVRSIARFLFQHIQSKKEDNLQKNDR